MADGNLNFDTKIDQSGFVKGIKSIGKGVTGFAADIKSLVDRAVSSFKQITAAYQVQIEAEARLGATMKNSTSATKEQIQSVKDLASSLQEAGVVGDEVQLAGAQELATYVGSVDSIKKMLPVLNDMIAQQYGFSASTDSAVTIATMLGKVLQGQTSALSRYGYKFDEAQEQLLKYGTEEQRVATLAAVVEESVSGVNKALADTPTGKVKQLSNDFGDLKETMGKFLTEIAYPIIVQLDVIVKKLNEVFSEASKGIKELFGIADDVSMGGAAESTAEMDDTSSDTADNFANIAESAKEAEKANKGSLAAFDELNVLAQETAETTEPDTNQSSLNVMPDGIGNGITLDIDADTGKAESKMSTFIDGIKLSLEDFFAPLRNAWDKHGKHIISSVKDWAKNLDFEPLKKSFDDLKMSAEPLVDTIGGGLSWFVDEILEPLGKWTIEEGVPAALDAISGAIDLIAAVGKEAGQWLGLLWDNFLSPAANWVGDTIVAFLELVGQVLTDVANNSTAVTVLTDIGIAIGAIALAIGAINIALGVMDALAAVNPLTWIIIAIVAIIVVIVELITYWDTLKEAWLEGVETWKGYLNKFVDWFKNGWSQFANWWTDKVTGAWNTVKDGAKKAWSGIKSVFGKVAEFFGKIFSAAWSKVKEVFSKGGEIFTGIKEGIVNAFKSIVNSLIDAINNIVRVPFEGINSALDGIRGVEIFDWKPFEWLPSISIPQIPRLATGTVIPANYGEFAAILGDNKRDPEIVSPIPAMKQAFLEALAEAGVIGGSNSGDIVIEIDGREVFRATKKQAEHYRRMYGKPAFG